MTIYDSEYHPGGFLTHSNITPGPPRDAGVKGGAKWRNSTQLGCKATTVHIIAHHFGDSWRYDSTLCTPCTPCWTHVTRTDDQDLEVILWILTVNWCQTREDDEDEGPSQPKKVEARVHGCARQGQDSRQKAELGMFKMPFQSWQSYDKARELYMRVSIVMGVPLYRWMVSWKIHENPIEIWMRTR